MIKHYEKKKGNTKLLEYGKQNVQVESMIIRAINEMENLLNKEHPRIYEMEFIVHMRMRKG